MLTTSYVNSDNDSIGNSTLMNRLFVLIGATVEASEVLELFLWQDEPTSLDDLKDELADVLVYVTYLCDKYGLNMDEIVQAKMEKNAKKYPIEKCYGKSTKYNKL